ncbi:MAG: transposase [Bacteroidota bacterium]
MFKTPLANFINKNHELVHLAHQISWQGIEDEFATLYAETSSPNIPIRKIGGLSMLKRMFHESDESVIQRWIENPYWQYFCGEIYFQDEAPFDSSSFVPFRDRIGPGGLGFLLQHSLEEEQGKTERERH